MLLYRRFRYHYVTPYSTLGIQLMKLHLDDLNKVDCGLAPSVSTPRGLEVTSPIVWEASTAFGDKMQIVVVRFILDVGYH